MRPFVAFYGRMEFVHTQIPEKGTVAIMTRDYQFADLSRETKEELDLLEMQLSRDCNRPIVLVAYEQRKEGEQSQ